jgi:hypothetical protein
MFMMGRMFLEHGDLKEGYSKGTVTAMEDVHDGKDVLDEYDDLK